MAPHGKQHEHKIEEERLARTAPLLLLPIATVLAHVPHDIVVAMAIPPTVSPDAPWLVAIRPHRSTALFRSDDGGASWEAIGTSAAGDLLLEGAGLDDGALIFRSAERIWWTRDGGDTWANRPSPPGVTAMSGGRDLLLATEEGLWTGPVEGSLSWTDIRVTGASSDGRLLWTNEAGWRWDGAGATAIQAFDGEIRAAAESGGVSYLGDSAGRVWREGEAGWEPCAALPVGVIFPEIRALEAGEGGLFVVTSEAGPYLGVDGCDAWQAVLAPIAPEYEEKGAAATPEEGFTAFYAGERLVLGGWMGVATADADGEGWHPGSLLGAGYTRGLAFSPTWPEDPRIFVGGLGAGVLATRDDGLNLLPGSGFLETNSQGVWSSDEPDVSFAIINHVPYRTIDGGTTWDRLDQFGEATMVVPWSAGWLWIAGEGPDGEGVYESLDGGETWARLPTWRDRATTHFRWEDGTICSVKEVLRCGEGEEWEVLWVFSDSPSATAAAGDTTWIADATTLNRCDPAGCSVEATYDGDPVVALAIAGEEVYGATRSGRIRGRRGGAWMDLGVQASTEITAIKASPDYQNTPVLLLTTLQGVWRVDDPEGTPTLSKWASAEWADDSFDLVSCPAGSALTFPGARGVGATWLPPGQVLWTELQGSWLRIWGQGGDGSEVWVDGAFVGEMGDDFTATDARLGVLAVAGLGEAGWHQASVKAGRDGVWIDGIEAGDLPWEGPVLQDASDAQACGCSQRHERDAAIGSMVALAAGLRRRRGKG